ncbi:S-adenosyl-L-methionine-dependent methyltransferase [Xylaria grammica]|nr:S-adenosyl-L-methionine-dependent methyltransferase [Xylaria grammica]
MEGTPRIIELAAVISESVAKIQALYSSHNLPSPSFDVGGEDVPRLPREIQAVQEVVLDATSELQDLLMDPSELLYNYAAHNNLVSLQAISRFDVARLVPKDGLVPFEEIAQHTGLGESMTRRLLRHAMTMRVFREPVPGMVAHTKTSKALVDLPHLNGWCAAGADDMWSAATKLVDAAQKWPNTQEVNESGFALANNMTSFYDAVYGNPKMGYRFSEAMKNSAASPEFHADFVTNFYDWNAIGSGSGSVVDVGGSRGHIAMAIARRYPSLTFTVQDSAEVVDNAEVDVPEDLRGRIKFMPHDLFAPQQVQADVYYLRWVLHNWPDKHAIAVLRAQIPALRKGTRILINESCMPEPGSISARQEKKHRSFDLTMAALFNGSERTVDEWRSLLAQADKRFVLTKTIQPPSSALAIMEVVWDGEDDQDSHQGSQ